MTRRSPSTRGFTLIELLVALAIMGSAFSAALSLIGHSMKGQRHAEQLRRAVELAQGQLASLGESIDGPAERSGESEDLHWRVEVTPLTIEQLTHHDSKSASVPAEVSVRVFGSDEAAGPVFSLSTVRLLVRP
jgi:prepilin-type N-terminal cleavage/methylation domain-containing protein